MAQLMTEIEKRLQAAYARVAAGDDLPPGIRYRLEGLLEAAVITGQQREAELLATIAAVHEEVLGESPAALYGRDWQTSYPFPEFPAWQRRAPVTPSTAD
jgi:hypothetical protein